MAEVTSLTATRIQELLAGWEGVGLSQEEINSLVVQLKTVVLANAVQFEDFFTTVQPQLEAEISEASNAVADLNDNVLPQLQLNLDHTKEQLDILNDVTLPSLQENLDNANTNIRESPKVYIQDEPPEDPDDDGRDLVVGDTWHDSNNNNAETIWNGVEWTTFQIDVADFSITAQKLKTNTHMLY